MTLTKNTLQSQTVRSSGVELLKILAILAICLSHCTQTMEAFIDFQEPTLNIELLVLRFLRFGGNIGNLVFIISSSYFLYNKDVKRKKAFNLLFDSQFISVIILIVFCVLGLLLSFKINYSLDFFLQNIFPDLYECVWFVPAYVMIYFIHPAIDLIINNISQKKHLTICFTLFVFCSLRCIINYNGFSVTINLFKFIAIYFIVAYMKKYMKNIIFNKTKNIKIFITCFCMLIVCVLLKNYLGLHQKFFIEYFELCDLMSPVLLPMMLSLFYIFLNLDFKNKAINYLSSCSLFVYCIHENILIREEIRPKFYEFMIEKSNGVNHCLQNVLLLFVIIVVCSFIAAIIYKQTINKITAKLSVKADSFICKSINKITTRLIKKENNNET